MSAGAQVGFAPPRARRPVAAPVKGTRVFAGFDLGTHFGYGVVDEHGSRVDSGVWDFDHRGKEAKQDPGARWLRGHSVVRDFLGRWTSHATYKLGGVAYELVVAHTGTRPAHVYGGFESLLLTQCSALNICPDTVTVSQVKLIAVGAGGGKRADKDAVVRAARNRWPECSEDDNEADAMWVADLLRRRVMRVAL